MNKTSKTFIGYGIWIIVILIITSVIFAVSDKTNLDNQHFSLILNFAATMGTLLAVALALIALKRLTSRFMWKSRIQTKPAGLERLKLGTPETQ